MNNYIVYALIDPSTSLPFYIGNGKERRPYAHLKETEKTTINKRKFYKIRKILAEGKEPSIVILESNLSKAAAIEKEREYIQKYGRKDYDKDGILTNICLDSNPPGNNNFLVDNPSSKTRGMTYEERYGVERAAKIRETRSKSLRGRKFSETTLQNMANSAKLRVERDGIHRPVAKGMTFEESYGEERAKEIRKQMSDSHTNVPRCPHSDEGKRNISLAKLEWMKLNRTICEFCGKETNNAAYKRYHGDNCKMKVSNYG